MWHNDLPNHPLLGFLKAFIEIYRSNNSLKGVPEDLAHLKGIVEFIEVGDFLDAHLNSQFIKLVSVHHLASHFGEKAFFLVGIFFKKKISDYTRQYGIAEILEAFVIFIGTVANRSVSEGGLIQSSFPWAKAEYISQVLFVRNAALISNKSVQDSHKYKLQ